ncbi:GNAT family N-acetyltransferase [Vagococcus coleopterorum]|uniref:GNAT family N-acetyltransferase n=1 Tax=Vagococcus coleopterorum TaxID=2714946 RepID=A0A6G8APF3_9ENTE|nr:GNAT family N-acetyltransferase [Vagococcus coleopterorum]QIL46867.1 GNAT family N-acetyltransferase [Vagococcus coleopterorum]
MTEKMIETERLIIRVMVESDLENIVKLNADEQVMTYFPSVMSKEESVEFLTKVLAHQGEHGYSFYAVELKGTNQFIGIVSLVTVGFESDIQGQVEIGWRFLPEYWGKGYAQEAAQATLNYGHEHFGIEIIYAFTATINQPSENLMKRLGMKKVGEFAHPKMNDDSPLKQHVLYCNQKR